MTAGTPAPQDAGAVDEHVRREVAYLMWQINEGYLSTEDRAVGSGANWMALDHEGPLHPDDEAELPEWLEVADALLAALAPVRAREVEAAQREAWDEFVQRIATHHAYNGADYPGQRFYDEGLNAWLISLPNPYRDLAATHAETEHVHAWANATNPAVRNTEVCVDCGSIRGTRTHADDEQRDTKEDDRG